MLSVVANHPLLAEVEEIDTTLLTSVTTIPPDRLRSDERTMTRAYLLVTHAVLEERIENIFLAHFFNARAVIDSGSAIPAGLLPFYSAALEWAGIDPPTYAKRTWRGYMSSSVAEAHVKSVIQNNHGLKRNNIQDLAKLVGIEWAAIDDAPGVEISALTTLGAKRGAAGHTSPFIGPDQAITEEEYPANVREWVNNAVRTVIHLEDVISQMCATQTAHPSDAHRQSLMRRSRALRRARLEP
ncbi:hypothetical protein ACWGST_03065 [Agromyces sp. NPDC055520]